MIDNDLNIKTGINLIDEQTGGLIKNAINLIAGTPNVGLTNMLFYLTRQFLLQGKNVLYITPYTSYLDYNQLLKINEIIHPIIEPETSPGKIFFNNLGPHTIGCGVFQNLVHSIEKNNPDIVIMDSESLYDLQHLYPDFDIMIQDECFNKNFTFLSGCTIKNNIAQNNIFQSFSGKSLSIVRSASLVVTLNKNEDPFYSKKYNALIKIDLSIQKSRYQIKNLNEINKIIYDLKSDIIINQ